MLISAAACSDDALDAPDAPEPRAAPEPFTYAAVGASDSVGVGAAAPAEEAWPVVLHQTAMHENASIVNLGVSGSTVKDALAAQVGKAVGAAPRLVTVWLAVNDLVRLVPPQDYERDLEQLVKDLRRGGQTEVLLGNAPPIEKLPVVRACLPNPPSEVRCRLPIRIPSASLVTARVDAYNQAIARIAERQGAVLVDLHGSAQASFDGMLVASDGFHPSTEGHRRIAEVFAASLPAFARG